ncbi:MAG TPA: hypothetical protein VNW05_08940 [Steroidobacteraceae bacterium]|jgi:hypothetical protein|nr:hypothetical protein [Steroidobacteraceae bacterium]
MNPRLAISVVLVVVLCVLRAAPAAAEPYLAVQTGYKCNICHFNPTGGALRTEFGITYAKTLLPAETIDNSLISNWTGKITDNLRVGGDLREDWTRDSAPNTPTTQGFSLEQFRVYGAFTLIQDRLAIYADEQVAPGGSQNEEAYVLYGSTTGFYIKGGQFYLPFGWRLQDQNAFVQELSGISMATPDKGVEIGYERPSWSAQFDVTNGVGNGTSGHGYQVTSQVAYVQPIWRLGVAGSYTQAAVGDRRVGGVFAGLRTGPVSWLAEGDAVRDDSFPDGRTLAAGLLEADWLVRRGHNLKVTAEWYDPDRSVAENEQNRYSIIYEYTPIPFLQLRGGYRRYIGIPQSNTQNQRQVLAELHGYF